jgi:hypothetical protein
VGELVLAAAYTAAIVPDRRLRIEIGVVPKALVAAAAAVALWRFVDLGDVGIVFAASGVYFAVLALLRGIPNELHEAFLRDDR